VDSDTQILRTVMRICAPILSNFKRTVLHCALASSVPANPKPPQSLHQQVGHGGEVEPDLIAQ
jgi:hypothetical protein